MIEGEVEETEETYNAHSYVKQTTKHDIREAHIRYPHDYDARKQPCYADSQGIL